MPLNFKFLQGFFKRDKPGAAAKPPSDYEKGADFGDYGTPDKRKGQSRELFGKPVVDAFLTRGHPLPCQSSWVDVAYYRPQQQELEIHFNDGWVAIYGQCRMEDAESFAVAPSKGKWIHLNIKGGYQADGRHWHHRKPYRGHQG